MRVDSDDGLHNLAGEFFREFARTEYSLKAAGYLTVGRNAAAMPDWSRFAWEIGPRILNSADPHVRAAIRYMSEHPPMKQVVDNGQLTWQLSRLEGHRAEERLFVFLRRVRNNLFHGGKFNGRWFEPERSDQLMTHALCLLRYCREVDPRLREAYEG